MPSKIMPAGETLTSGITNNRLSLIQWISPSHHLYYKNMIQKYEEINNDARDEKSNATIN